MFLKPIPLANPGIVLQANHAIVACSLSVKYIEVQILSNWQAALQAWGPSGAPHYDQSRISNYRLHDVMLAISWPYALPDNTKSFSSVR
jgi:hypothetical protein